MAKKKNIYKIKPLNDNKRNIIQSITIIPRKN